MRHALQFVGRQAGDFGLWLPFLIVAFVKVLLLAGAGRPDLLPPFVLAAVLQVLPAAAKHLHYPEIMLDLPRLDRALDIVLFVTTGAVLQGWAVLRLEQARTGRVVAFLPDARRGAMRLLSLVAFSGTLAGVPYATLHLAHFFGQKELGPAAALTAGIAAQVLLFTAPAFLVLRDLSPVASLAASLRLVGRLPVALPLAVLLVGALHLPGLLLRGPAIAAGAWRDPDWILAALLVQIPVDLCGAVLSAGMAAYFVLVSRTGREPDPQAESHERSAEWARSAA